ncbi:hypothetical protein ACGFWI_13765 [Streptomyces sp. NPDC048434]|uniref:hypothetical protein n=1 Tax=Streptomyces sp. NPDC048434 TaxID=3365549 RepID=UPI00371569A3
MADGNEQTYSDNNAGGFKTDSSGTWADAGGDTTGDYSNWDWRKIMSAIHGGAAYSEDAANADRAQRTSDPQTIQTAADSLYYTQRVLQEVAKAVSEQTEALTGEHGPWQGQAARALNSAMTKVARHTEEMANVISGGVTGDNSVPQQLADNAQHLREAIAKVNDIDVWYANQATQLRPDLRMDNGLVMVSKNQQIVKMMSDDMRQVLQALAKHYVITKDSVSQPGSPSDPNSTGAPGPSTGKDATEGVPGSSPYGLQSSQNGPDSQMRAAPAVGFGPDSQTSEAPAAAYLQTREAPTAAFSPDSQYGGQPGYQPGSAPMYGPGPGYTHGSAPLGQYTSPDEYYGGADQDPYGAASPTQPGAVAEPLAPMERRDAVGEGVLRPVEMTPLGGSASVQPGDVDAPLGDRSTPVGQATEPLAPMERRDAVDGGVLRPVEMTPLGGSASVQPGHVDAPLTDQSTPVGQLAGQTVGSPEEKEPEPVGLSGF